MNQRAIALATGALLTASLLGACTRGPKPAPGGPPAFRGQDCGTIDVQQASARDSAAIACYNQYHVGTHPSIKLTFVNARESRTSNVLVTRIYQSPEGSHEMYITTVKPDGSSSTELCSGPGLKGVIFDAGQGQAFINRDGSATFDCT